MTSNILHIPPHSPEYVTRSSWIVYFSISNHSSSSFLQHSFVFRYFLLSFCFPITQSVCLLDCLELGLSLRSLVLLALLLILFAEFVISLNLHINQGILITLTLRCNANTPHKHTRTLTQTNTRASNPNVKSKLEGYQLSNVHKFLQLTICQTAVEGNASSKVRQEGK